MTENNQNRILRVATLLADASYPILSGLDDRNDSVYVELRKSRDQYPLLSFNQ